MVRKAVNDLIKYGSVQRAYMGVEYIDGTKAGSEAVSKYGLDKSNGVYVNRIVPNSGAAKAGLQKGDFITHINGKPTPDLESFLKAVVGIPDNTCTSSFPLSLSKPQNRLTENKK